MRPRYWRGVGGIPRRSTLASAVAYATAREGLDSLVALVSARGGPVTTLWNRGTVAVPAIERLSPWEWAEASYGGVDLDEIFDVVGTGSLDLEEGVGLVLSGTAEATEKTSVPAPHRLMAHTVDLSIDWDTGVDGQGVYVCGYVGAAMVGGGAWRDTSDSTLKAGAMYGAPGSPGTATFPSATVAYTPDLYRVAISAGSHVSLPTTAGFSAVWYDRSAGGFINKYGAFSPVFQQVGATRLLLGAKQGGTEAIKLIVTRST